MENDSVKQILIPSLPVRKPRLRVLKLSRSSFVVAVAKSCPALSDLINCSTPSFPVLHRLPEFAQTHVRWVDGAIQPSHPLPPSSLFAFSLSKNQKTLRESGKSNQKHYRYSEISQEFSTSFSSYCEWLLFRSPPFESTYPLGSHKM